MPGNEHTKIAGFNPAERKKEKGDGIAGQWTI